MLLTGWDGMSSSNRMYRTLGLKLPSLPQPEQTAPVSFANSLSPILLDGATARASRFRQAAIIIRRLVHVEREWYCCLRASGNSASASMSQMRTAKLSLLLRLLQA